MNFGALSPTKRVAKFRYDFDTHGGAVGDIALSDLPPVGAIVTSGMVEVNEAVTSDGAATVALTLETAGDILDATGKASLTEGALIDAVAVHSAATAVKIVDATALTVTVAVAALTAGQIDVYVEYYQP
jgi:hypothetical protein